MTPPRQGWHPSREPALLPPAPRGAGSEAGARGREEGRPGDFPRLSPGSINHRSRGGGRAGKCAEPECSVVAPDTSLSPPLACLLSHFFFKASPSPSSLGRLPQPRSRVAAPPRGCRRPPAPPPPRSAGTLGKRKLGRARLRLSAPRPAPPGAAPPPSETPAAPRGPRRRRGPGDRSGGRFLSRPPPEPGDGGRQRSRAVAGAP